ncbi:MAG: hypothetical protein AB1634_16645 [Thermodesulfobacteriota bacterium]
MHQLRQERLAGGKARGRLPYVHFEDERLAGLDAAHLGFFLEEYGRRVASTGPGEGVTGQRRRSVQRRAVPCRPQEPGRGHRPGYSAPAALLYRGRLPGAPGLDGVELGAPAHGEPAQGLSGGPRAHSGL